MLRNAQKTWNTLAVNTTSKFIFARYMIKRLQKNNNLKASEILYIALIYLYKDYLKKGVDLTHINIGFTSLEKMMDVK
jgi:hypothetical protein